MDNKDYNSKLKQHSAEINKKETLNNIEEDLLKCILDDSINDIMINEKLLEVVYKKWKKAYTFDNETYEKKQQKTLENKTPPTNDKRFRNFDEKPADPPIMPMTELQGFLDELFWI